MTFQNDSFIIMEWPPTPVFLPGESHGQRAWWATIHGIAESYTTELLSLSLSCSILHPFSSKSFSFDNFALQSTLKQTYQTVSHASLHIEITSLLISVSLFSILPRTCQCCKRNQCLYDDGLCFHTVAQKASFYFPLLPGPKKSAALSFVSET